MCTIITIQSVCGGGRLGVGVVRARVEQWLICLKVKLSFIYLSYTARKCVGGEWAQNRLSEEIRNLFYTRSRKCWSENEERDAGEHAAMCNVLCIYT